MASKLRASLFPVLLAFSLSLINGLEVPTKRDVVGDAQVSASLNQLPIWKATKDPSYDPYASDRLGVHVPTLTKSIRCGPNGPLLMMDRTLSEALGALSNERIPERIVHVKGAGAHGYFEVTHDISYYTKASLFSKIGKKTRVFTRFSPVLADAGSPDTLRESRGMAIKFYTDDGIWNFLGFSIPVIPVRDPLTFPSLIRAAKRNPATHLRDYIALFDVLSQTPESTLNFLITFSDTGIPNGYRHMDGFSITTFELINGQGQVSYGRFYWMHDLPGKSYLNSTEAAALAGAQPDYAIQDLYDAIGRGDWPTWTLYVQLLTVEQVQNYKFDVFDATKVLDESDFPLRIVGKLTLNRNPSNYFQEVESSAFCPADLVPGIQMSPLDFQFHARSLAYRDTQRHRLGPNFDQLPINRPQKFDENLKPYSYERDGPCNSENYDGGPNYFPNSFGGPGIDPKAHRVDTLGLIQRSETGEDNFSQSTAFVRGLTPDAFQRLCSNLATALATTNDQIVDQMLRVYANVDANLVGCIKLALPQAKEFLKSLGIKINN